MSKTLVIKNRSGRKLGEILFSRGEFAVKVRSKEKKHELQEIISGSLSGGIANLGEVILTKPLKPKNPLFFKALADLLARRGYILISRQNDLKDL